MKNREAVRTSQRAANLKYRGGGDLGKLEALYVGQDGRCAICRTPGPLVGTRAEKGLCLDHDHASGATRGLLCSHCNVALGHMKDSAENLRRAAAYLEASRT